MPLPQPERPFKTPAPPTIAGSTVKPLGWYTDYKDPSRFLNIKDIRPLFNEIAQHKNISDIIIKTGEPVCIKTKRFGLRAITHRIINIDEVNVFATELSGDKAIAGRIAKGDAISGLASLLESAEYDHATGIQGEKRRYRYEIMACSSKLKFEGISIILRPLPSKPTSHDQLGIPLDFIENCIVKDGIVIVAGATGEGKSTTLAAVIRYILENDTLIKGNILTHEDPIEVSYDEVDTEHSMVTQSAIGMGQHILSFNHANRSAMRRSPDLVLLGELRDEDTVEAAVELSLTGHPVYATTHASSISAIMPRLISRFPQELQAQKAFDLIDTMRFLVAQKLIWTTEGKLMAVRETLVITEALKNYLLPFTKSTDVLYRKINQIMDKELLGAVSYKGQANRLLEDGIIDEKNYKYLVGAGVQFTDEELKKLDDL